MGIKVYCGRATLLLFAPDGDRKTLKPLSFDEVDPKFTADPMWDMAVRAGTLQVFDTVKQGDKAERKVREKKTAEEKDEGASEKGEAK